MTWNYRVIKKRFKAGRRTYTTYAVHEVYYNRRGRPTSWTTHPIELSAFDSLTDLKISVLMLYRDIKGRPVLEEKKGKLVEAKR